MNASCHSVANGQKGYGTWLIVIVLIAIAIWAIWYACRDDKDKKKKCHGYDSYSDESSYYTEDYDSASHSKSDCKDSKY